MSDKSSFIVHYDISDVTDELSDEDAGKLYSPISGISVIIQGMG